MFETCNYSKAAQYPTLHWKMHKLKKGMSLLVVSFYEIFIWAVGVKNTLGG